jgi:hypothetical protein
MTPDHVSTVDMLGYQLAQARVDNAELALQLAKEQRGAAALAMRHRYGLVDADQIQPDGAIVRAPPEPAAAPVEQQS